MARHNNRELLYLNSPISIFYLVDLAARIMVSFPRILSFPFPSRKQFGSIASVFGAGQRPQYLCRLKSALRIRRRASGYEFFLPLESFIPFHRLITLSILIGTSFENHSFLPSFLPSFLSRKIGLEWASVNKLAAFTLASVIL